MTSSLDNKKIETAVKYLVQKISSSGKNEKPVIFHSIKVAMYLYNLGYPEEVIIGALLHDIVEDSEATIQEIDDLFGRKVSTIVDCLTINSTIKTKEAQFHDSINRAIKSAKFALAIRASDILDNCNYYHLAPESSQPWLYSKLTLIRKFLLENQPNKTILSDLERQIAVAPRK